MQSGSSARGEYSGRPDATGSRLRGELLAILDSEAAPDTSGRTSEPLDRILGSLSGLLIAKWAGYDESEREAIAAFDEEAFTPTLPEALRLSAWDHPTGDHARAVAEALGAITANSRATSAAARYVARIAPLVTRTVERSRPTYERVHAWVGRIEFGRPGSRALAARLLDDALHKVMTEQGRLVGEFATPTPVAALMLELADPEPGHKVYDPCFGFGELLVGAARRLREAARTASPGVWADIREAGIFGIEIDPIAHAVGLCRILLAGIDRPGLEVSDALDRPLPRNRSGDGFDRIMAVPPWGMRVSRTSTAHFPFPNRHSETLFLQHVMANLRPGGRAVVALPEGPLYRHGPDRQTRKALLSDYSVDAVVSLPAGAFAPWTSLSVNLMVFRRDPPRSAVRFVGISSGAWEAASETADRSRTELLRGVSDLVTRRRELLSGPYVSEVDAWDVPVRDLGHRDYELVPARSGSDALDAEIDRLVAADRTLKVERLERVADVFAGQSYPSRCTTRSHAAGDAMAGLVRAQDVEHIAGVRDADLDVAKEVRTAKGQVSPLFLTREGKARVKEQEFLRPFDVVVSTVGATGTVTTYPLPAARAASNPDNDTDVEDIAGSFIPLVPTSSVAVLRTRGGLTPLFLVVLLRSPAYRSWLSGQARGTTIRRLALRTLRRLRIPVPPVPVQEAVLREVPHLRGDAMAVLARLLSGASNDPVTVWLETPVVKRLASESTEGNEADRLGVLVVAAEAIQSLVVRTTHRSDSAAPEIDDRQVGAWLDVVRQAAAALDGVASIPRGAGRLTVVGVALARLLKALDILDKAEGSVVDRLYAFTRAMVELCDDEIHAMQASITLDIGVEPAEVIVGAISEVQLRLTNASTVPLRSLHVSTRPSVGTGQLPYLADGETHRIPLTIHPRDATRPHPIVVSWRAHRLDGTAVNGEVEVALRVLSTREVVRSGDLGASPYIVGNPVDRHEMFFGRTDIMDRIRRQLGAATHANVILIEGNRRTGKTSILRQLGKADALPGWIPVYCSLQDAEGDDSRGGITTRNVFKLLARTTGWALSDAGVETWLPGLPDRDGVQPYKPVFLFALNQAFTGGHAFETFELYLSAAVEAASPRRVLFMLDEFDKLQEGIDAGITSPQVPENLRHLLQHQPGVSAIITGSRRLKRLREDYWSALFGLGYRIGISALPRDAARRLVTEPVEGRLAYLPQARDRLVDLCACHPFLVQSLCNRVFEQAAAAGASTVTVDAVQQAATEMVRDNEHFRTLWDYTGTARRGLLLALCDRLQDEPDEVNLDLLTEELRKREVPVRRLRDLDDDLTELRELELLDFDESYRRGTYRLAVPLMAQWLRTNVDFDGLVVRAREEAMEAGW